MSEAVQFDVEWLIRYEKKGGHYHCDVFGRKVGQATYQKNGDLVVAENEWAAFQRLMHLSNWTEKQK